MDYKHEYLKLNKDLHEKDRRSKVKEILNILPNNYKVNSILDIACGSGNILRDVSKETGSENNTGIDISEEIIEIASKNNKDINCRWIASDIFDYNQEPVDLVLAIDIIEHVKDDDKLLAKLSSFGRYTILKVPIENNIINRKIIKISGGKINPLNDTELKYGHIHHYSLKDVLCLIGKSNLKIEKINYMHLPKRSKIFWEIIRLLFLPVWMISKKFYIILNGGFLVILLRKTES